ncbi:MAG: hypothetical protein FWG13_05315 [Leptospirales bacterium]|nr:hypothetical protein [Leptospirales bacterium]
MKKVIAALLLLTAVSVFAKVDKIKVNFTMDELAFSINAVDSIEISGDETAPYLDMKKTLMNAYKKASSAEKNHVDIVFLIPQAKNFLILLQRAKFRGAEAFLFSDISGKIVNALKKAGK